MHVGNSSPISRTLCASTLKSRREHLVTTIILAVCVLVCATSVDAANVYVRAGATGGNTGADWSNAYTSLPATLVRGNTYYVADGSYGSYSFDDPEAGSTYVHVRKAILSDHGTEVGWDNSYGDGDATFTSWEFLTGYYDIDGQVGKWASDLPGYQAYGFRVQRTATANNTKVINFPSGSNSINVAIKHVEASFKNVPLTGAWYSGMDVIYLYGDLINNVSFSYCWFHDGGRVIAILIGSDHILFDHCVLERNGQAQRAMGWSPSEHSEILMFQPNADYGIVRYSYVRDWSSTGGIILYDQNNNMEFYGNVFEQTGGYTTSNSNGALNGLSAATGLSAVAFNNTFANINYGCTVFTMGGFTSRITKNNLFFNCMVSSSPGATIGGTHDFNWFYSSGTQSEAHLQYGSGDPFINSANRDYRLSVGTSTADTGIGASFSVDLVGNVRGADGAWDRGAFEFQGGGGRLLQRPQCRIRRITSRYSDIVTSHHLSVCREQREILK